MGGKRGRRVACSDRSTAILSINQAREQGACAKAPCKQVGINPRTYQRWRKDPLGDQRKGPVSTPANKLTEEERRKILQIANSKEFADQPPSQIVPKLADRGEYVASESSFYRILKAENLDAHRGRSKSPSRKKPKSLVATTPNQVYSWDITYLKTDVAGQFVFLYFVMDVFSRKIVGYAVHTEQNAEHASVLIELICHREGIKKDQLWLHSDNGGPMKGATMLATLQRLGVMPSFSRPSVSDDNPYSESLFKTTKYCSLYPSKPFSGRVAALKWVKRFVLWYNEVHRHSGIKFVTPGSRHRGEDKKILNHRREVYHRAKLKNPNRWSVQARNWEHNSEVALNPLKGKESSCKKRIA